MKYTTWIIVLVVVAACGALLGNAERRYEQSRAQLQRPAPAEPFKLAETTKPTGPGGRMSVHIDAETGCHYLSRDSSGSSLTPRMRLNSTGYLVQWCDKP